MYFSVRWQFISQKSVTFVLETSNSEYSNSLNSKDMSEKQKQVEKERRGLLELLLQKNGLKRKELVDFLLSVWMAGKVDELTEQEKAQFPNLVF